MLAEPAGVPQAHCKNQYSQQRGQQQPEGEQYLSLFSGETGKGVYPCNIKLNPDSHPVCLDTMRKIAHPLMTKVKEQIDDVLKNKSFSRSQNPMTGTPVW